MHYNEMDDKDKQCNSIRDDIEEKMMDIQMLNDSKQVTLSRKNITMLSRH